MDLSVATGRKQTATDSCAGAGRKCPRSGILLMVSLDATELQLMISFIRTRSRLAALFCLALASALPLRSQENYIVTYSHELEEPGNLELAAKTWWTTELYLDGQTTSSESTLFTGFRLENRVRPLLREHWINPILYFEFEDINTADKALLEVVGHDSRADFLP